MKATMSIGRQIFWGKTFVGIMFIGMGITGIFDTLLCKVLDILFSVGAVLSITLIMRARREMEDEMAEHNYIRAKATTTDIMHYIYCIAAIATAVLFLLLPNINLNWGRIMGRSFLVLLGIQNVITGLAFRKLEAE